MLVASSRCGYGIFCVLPFRFVNLVRSHDTWRKIAVNPRRRHTVVGGMWRVEFSEVRWAAVDIGREDSADLGSFRNFSSQVHLLRSQKSKKQSSPLVALRMTRRKPCDFSLSFLVIHLPILFQLTFHGTSFLSFFIC
jgi:hypothetical protein